MRLLPPSLIAAALAAASCGGAPVEHLVFGRAVKAELACPGAPQPDYDIGASRGPAPGESFLVRAGEISDRTGRLVPVGPVVATFRSRADGTFTLDLPEGVYCVSRTEDPARCWKKWTIPDPGVKDERILEVGGRCPPQPGR